MNLRRATSADVGSIRDLVSRAYDKYVALIGRKPKPMVADYEVAVVQHQVWILELDEGIGAVIELVPESDHLLIENIAVGVR